MRKHFILSVALLAFTIAGCQKNTNEVFNHVTVTVAPTASIREELVTPTATAEPTATAAPTVAPTATPEPTATPVPTATPTPTATPVPTKAPVGQLTVKELKEEFADYGSFTGGAGMSAEDYAEAMAYEWKRVSTTEGYKKVEVDISKAYTTEDLYDIWKNLTSLDGVSMYEIGESVQGRPICMISIDRTTVDKPKTIVLTGNVHARETAGSIFITKQLNDLLNDENADDYLSKVRIFAVPCVNPDGRDGVAFDTANFTYSDGLLWKANANGVDLNRNFPGLSWGQIKKGNSKVYLISDSPTKMYFPGYTGGSEPETKALMKFLQYTVVDEQADILIDYHQQGRIQYAGKPWQTDEQEQRCIDLAKILSKFLANDKTYLYTPEDKAYGLKGEGSTLTDYACSLAVGAKFSEKYGFHVYTDGENEYPLIMGVKAGEEANPNFATATLEIGSGSAYLGYSEKTRKNLKSEYENYNFDRFLYQLFTYVLSGEDTTEEFKVLDQKEFPTGCESVSATMVLNHYGYDITTAEFVDNYLDTIATPEEFYEGGKNEDKLVYDYYFVGNPREEVGKACNAPVIIDAINEYFDAVDNHSKEPVNLTGLSFSEVVELCDEETPILLWVSGELKGSDKYTDFGQFRVWKNRHCCVLLNADKETGVVTVADPMIGSIREWDWNAVEEQFIKYGQQAVYLR